jgi:hypothetical protein
LEIWSKCLYDGTGAKEMESLTDKERLLKWNELCMDLGWAKSSELEIWLKMRNVKFTPSGSCMAPEIAVKITANELIPQLLGGEDAEVFIRMLETYCGFICFISSGLEAEYWKYLIDRLEKQHIIMPPELVPTYIRNILKYPPGSFDTVLE